jgi:hypothetical protein
VAHGGETAGGSFVHTLVLTDIATGWTECIALLVRESSVIVDALERLRLCLPFPLRGIDTDNGSEFINETLLAFSQRYTVEFTRSRPYRKNDQAWVEQKNGSVVRRLVGYGRLEGVAAAEALTRLYSASRLFVNFFQPSFRLADLSHFALLELRVVGLASSVGFGLTLVATRTLGGMLFGVTPSDPRRSALCWPSWPTLRPALCCCPLRAPPRSSRFESCASSSLDVARSARRTIGATSRRFGP